jgi:hypothetical protein
VSDATGYGPRECGSCRLWSPKDHDARGEIGPCRLAVRTGYFPGTAPICERFLSRDAAVPATPPPEVTRHRSRTIGPVVVVHRHGEAPAPAPAPGLGRALAAAPLVADLPPLPEELTDMTREEFAQAIREALREDAPPVRLAARWEGGTVVLKPGDPGTQSKEIPLDSLFHKIVMIRDRLRVLEQKINGHEKMTDAEKVELQQFVTRCYGSLTTFNLLFKDEKDKFTGEKT